jgi:hypothetical protein
VFHAVLLESNFLLYKVDKRKPDSNKNQLNPFINQGKAPLPLNKKKDLEAYPNTYLIIQQIQPMLLFLKGIQL